MTVERMSVTQYANQGIPDPAPVRIDGIKRLVKGDNTAIFMGRTDDKGREIWTWIPTRFLSAGPEHGQFFIPAWLAARKNLTGASA